MIGQIQANGRGFLKMFNLYQNNYVIVVVFFCFLGILLPVVALTAGKLLRPNRPSAAKQTTYESGIEPFHEANVRFHARYYIFLRYCLSSLMWKQSFFVSMGSCL
ncbi:hypothetical protein GCM10020331_023520 [Ectobacillus funiculus]